MTDLITYAPAIEPADSGDELEDPALDHNDGYSVYHKLADRVHESYAEDPEALERDWTDFCEQASDRDALKPPGVKHWLEVVGADAASDAESAYELLVARADEAKQRLRLGMTR